MNTFLKHRGLVARTSSALLLAMLGLAAADPPPDSTAPSMPATEAGASTAPIAVGPMPAGGTAAQALAAPGVLSPRAAQRAAEADVTAARLVERVLAQVRNDEGEPRRMSLVEAVRAAVENNPGIRGRAEIPNRQAYAPYGAEGAFDPHFRANAHASSIHSPSGSALASGKVNFDEEAVRGGASIGKLLRSGANMDLTWNSQAINTNSVFYQINPRYDNRLTLSLRQPLLRNFWASNETTTVLVARSEAEESLAAFEAELSDFVARVISVYWNYERAAADLEVARRSVALAKELVRDAEAKVNVGLLAPVAVKEAEADAAAREERAIRIENALTIAAQDLKHQVMLGAAASNIPVPILPIEEHVVTPIEVSRADSLKTAIECRAEIRGATYALDKSRLLEKNARNQTLPDLDVVAHYGQLGLTGDSKLLRDDDGNTIPDPSGGFVNASPYDGNYGDSIDQWFDRDFRDFAVGLELEIPFGNADAKATLAQAEIDVRRASRELEQTLSSVGLDVDRALADLDSAAKRVVAAKASRDLAEENLRNQTRRFELGAVTTKDVLDFQEKLAQAQAAEVGAITDHALSVARLRVADGTLLARFGIEIQNPDAPGRPWWFRF
jgi:outer membrane protein